MKSVLVLSFLIAGVLCHPTPNKTYFGSNAEVGEPCTPIALPICGEPELLMETSTPVVDGNGTNVCDIEKAYSFPVYSYEYKEKCGKRRCRITCKSTGNCTSSKNITESKTSCCEGFTTAQTNTSKEYCNKHTCPGGKPKMETLQQEGCPREILPTVLDCLKQLNLSSLGEVLLETGFDVVASNDAKISLFAPSTELDRNYAEKDLLGTHIVNKTILAAFLENGDKLETLSEGLFLHISQIKQDDEEVLFVNGIELTERDACVANNGIVHVIDDFIFAERSTIAETLENTTESSIFSLLFEAAGGDEPSMTESSCKLRTLFVPTDEAFAEFQSKGYVECLLMEQNKNTLEQFLKNHTSEPAHYSSSLVLQEKVEVVSKAKRGIRGRHPHYITYFHLTKQKNVLQIQVVDNGTILLGSDEAEVIEEDIAASDGVIHLISKPLFTSIPNLERLCTTPTDQTETPTRAPTQTETPTRAPTQTETPTRAPDPRPPDSVTRTTPTNSHTYTLE